MNIIKNINELKEEGQLHENTLVNADCLEAMKLIPNKSVDMILCDLPYGTTACKWDSIIPFEPLWKEYNRIIKDSSAIVLFGTEPFSSYLRMSNIEMYKYDWIWNKGKPSNFQLMNYQPGKVHELISVFSKGKTCYTKNNNSMNYFPQKVKREKIRVSNAKIYKTANLLHNYNKIGKDNITIYTDKLPITIIDIKNERHKFHPTQKPMALLEYLIKTYSNDGDVILDNTMGSGSTGVACVNTNRKFIGIELDENYFNIAKNRIEEVYVNREHKTI